MVNRDIDLLYDCGGGDEIVYACVLGVAEFVSHVDGSSWKYWVNQFDWESGRFSRTLRHGVHASEFEVLYVGAFVSCVDKYAFGDVDNFFAASQAR